MPPPWFLYAIIAAWMVLACLRVIGSEAGRAIAWHDLRVAVQRLRRAQQRRLAQVEDKEPTLRRISRRQQPTSAEMPSLTAAVDPVQDAVEVLETQAVAA